MENPVFLFKHAKWEIVAVEILHLLSIISGLVFTFRGVIEKDWFYMFFGIGIVIFAVVWFRKHRLEIRGYLAVYTDRIVEKSVHTKVIMLKDVLEMRYFKKR